MAQAEPKKIVYLFGAGATHAEIQNLYPELISERRGLLIGNVSSRVIERARQDKRYLKGVELVSATSGSLNIELLISLIEGSKIHEWENKTRRLKQLVREDIETILSPSLVARFHLHKALFELHAHPLIQPKEQVVGLISLNYENVLDEAYVQYHGAADYGFSIHEEARPGTIPLLKLHGSFNWKNIVIRGRRRTVEIIPLGSSKSYVHAPYGFIWARALDVLTECNTVRVVGCSLSQNDIHLIDLLFKAQLERAEALEIEIISFEDDGRNIRGNYGFFPRIKTWLELGDLLMPESSPANPFKTWLKYKSISVLRDSALKTRYVRKILI